MFTFLSLTFFSLSHFFLITNGLSISKHHQYYYWYRRGTSSAWPMMNRWWEWKRVVDEEEKEIHYDDDFDSISRCCSPTAIIVERFFSFFYQWLPENPISMLFFLCGALLMLIQYCSFIIHKMWAANQANIHENLMYQLLGSCSMFSSFCVVSTNSMGEYFNSCRCLSVSSTAARLTFPIPRLSSSSLLFCLFVHLFRAC